MKGGFLQSLGRKIANGESFFQQSIEAVHGNGETLLAPDLPRHFIARLWKWSAV